MYISIYIYIHVYLTIFVYIWRLRGDLAALEGGRHARGEAPQRWI